MSLFEQIVPLRYPAECHDKSIPHRARKELKSRCLAEYQQYRPGWLQRYYAWLAEIQEWLDAVGEQADV